MSPKNQPLVAIGSNEEYQFGGAVAIVKAAIIALGLAGLPVRSVSRLYRTPCFPAGYGPDFINATVGLSSDLPAQEILKRLHEVEDEYRRGREKRWGPRTLDLDLLAIGGQILPNKDKLRHWMELPIESQLQSAPDQLILPHPRLQDRSFVLIPLSEIAPDWEHPVTGKTVTEMVNELPEVDKTAITPIE